MALRLVRQTSDTPNITNKDDTVMTRYAYGGFNGVVKSFGSECGYIAENGVFKILDGRILIDGWEIDVDGAGWTLNLSSVSGIQYHSVYAEISVSIESVKIDSYYTANSYPEVEKGDDLTLIQNGTARILLYNVKVENGTITEVNKRFEVIPYLAQKVLDTKQRLEDLTNSLEDGSVKPKIALYASEDISKGTIEERLTRLGFTLGSVTGISGATLTKQGKYAILTVPDKAFTVKRNNDEVQATMSFTALNDVSSNGIVQKLTSVGNYDDDIRRMQINISGNSVVFSSNLSSGTTPSDVYTNRKVVIGFEISSW